MIAQTIPEMLNNFELLVGRLLGTYLVALVLGYFHRVLFYKGNMTAADLLMAGLVYWLPWLIIRYGIIGI